MLSGFIAPDSGRIVGLSGKKASFVFQENRLLGSATVLQNIEAVLEKGNPNAENWLETVGLKNEAFSFPRELSGGMRRKVALARALAYGGEVYFMDEPFRGIDAAGREELIPKIRAEIKGKLAFLVTHDIDEARLVGDWVVSFARAPVSSALMTRVSEEDRRNARIPQIDPKERE
jgi:NitT/TauT family transport system ATP-binding protein